MAKANEKPHELCTGDSKGAAEFYCVEVPPFAGCWELYPRSEMYVILYLVVWLSDWAIRSHYSYWFGGFS